MTTKTLPFNVFDDIKGLSKEYLTKLISIHPLIVFKNQSLTDNDFNNISAMFGKPIQETELQKLYPYDIHLDNFDTIIPLSSDGMLGSKELEWHQDNSFIESTLGRLLYAKSIPNDTGKTCWADTSKIFATLPKEYKQKLSAAKINYSYNIANLDIPKEAEYTSVCKVFNEQTGLNLNFWIEYAKIENTLNISLDELAEIVDYIKTNYLDNKEFIYTHTWDEGDLIFFNNLTTIHRRDKIITNDKKRILYRVTVIL